MTAQDSKNKAIAFIDKYYSNKYEKHPRKSFTRLCDAIKQTSGAPCYDNETMEALYVNLTGERPYYYYATHSPKWYANMQAVATDIVNHLTNVATSLSDIYRECNPNVYPWYAPSKSMPHEYDSIRKCFKAMADQGVIGCVSLKTCGRIALRLYYLND